MSTNMSGLESGCSTCNVYQDQHNQGINCPPITEMKDNQYFPGNWANHLEYDFCDPARPQDLNYQHVTYLEQFETYFPHLRHLTTKKSNPYFI